MAVKIQQQNVPAKLSVFLFMAILLASGCSPVTLNKPDSTQVSFGATSSPPTATGPVFSIEFQLKSSYQPGTLHVTLNGSDITGRFMGCAGGNNQPCAAPTQLTDFPLTPAKETLTWTAACNGAVFCSNANFVALFQVFGLAFDCSPLVAIPGPPSHVVVGVGGGGRGSSGVSPGRPAPNCMTTSEALGLNAGGGSGAVTVFTGVPAPPGGIDIQVVPDPAVFWLSINGGPFAAPAVLHITPRDQQIPFSVGVNVAGLPRLPPGSPPLQTAITISAIGFAQSKIPVIIQP
jgi:hypothetical protein